MRFEILLERNGLVFGPESNGNLNLPRPKLGSMQTLSGVVLLETRFRLGGHSNVIPLTICKAAKYINVIKHVFFRLAKAKFDARPVC